MQLSVLNVNDLFEWYNAEDKYHRHLARTIRNCRFEFGGDDDEAKTAGKNAVYLDCANLEHACFFYVPLPRKQPVLMRKALVEVNTKLADLSVRSQYHVLNWLLSHRKQEHLLQDHDETALEVLPS
jgi:hypothetical protein